MKKLVVRLFRSMGYELMKTGKQRIPPDFESLHLDIYEKVRDYTMTSPERIFSLIEAVRYIEKNNIPGAIVECGVWKGGSMMAVAESLLLMGDASRDLYLYDTFEGMPAPGEKDKTWSGEPADNLLNRDTDKENNLVWAYSTIGTVREAMNRTQYPENRIHYVQGKVEDTIPDVLPGEIAVLRLDTDWYESTRHELQHLYPLLQNGGVLILDDYGHWQGARKAVDEYFAQHMQPILLNRIDETGRIAIKQIG
jgi:O-methyltransferase